MSVKKLLSIICALCFILSGLMIMPQNMATASAAKYYCENSYFESEGSKVKVDETIYFDHYELSCYYLERGLPMYTNFTQLNSCAPMAATILLSYYDYEYPELIPNFTSGFYYGNRFRYSSQSSIITSTKEELYDLMGTNSVQPGTSVAQFKNGLTSYVNKQGYNLSYYSCGNTFNIDLVDSYLKQGIPITLFINSYRYVDSIAFDEFDDRLELITTISTNGHVLVAYGYCLYKFYDANGNLTETRNFMISSFGDGSLGYLDITNLNCIDEAYAIKIY